MALQFFEVQRGYAIGDDNTTLVQILTGTGAPGGDTGEQDDAPIGSIYLRTDTGGGLYYKTVDNDDANDWASPQAMVAGSTLTQSSSDNVTTATTIDTAVADDIVAVHWLAWAEDNATGANKRAIEITATHNNIDGGADATTVDWSKYSRLKIGATITGLVVDVVLAGAAALQTIGLQVTSTTAVNVRAVRYDVLR